LLKRRRILDHFYVLNLGIVLHKMCGVLFLWRKSTFRSTKPNDKIMLHEQM
jgi:hypothetical protein